MKKFILFVFVFVVLGAGVSIALAAYESGCSSFGPYNTITGKLCNAINPVVECNTGDLFNATTGRACTSWKNNSVNYSGQEFGMWSRGERVREFQQLLKDEGYLFGKVDGIYGPITDNAAKKYYRVCPPESDGPHIMMKYRFCRPSAEGPVISGVSGPQSLKVNQEGTWKVTAYDKKGGDLSYSVVWGDEYTLMPMKSSMMSDGAVQQSATFTHRYSQSGIYTPKFTVTNSSGGKAETSLSVNVGGVIGAKKLHIVPAAANIKVGETATFQAFLTPASLLTTCSSSMNTGCVPPPEPVVQVIWTSSDTKVVTVQYKNTCPPGAYCFVATDYLTAVATGVSEGNATIKATYTDASGNIITDTASVTVENSKKLTITSLSSDYGMIGSQITLYGNGFTSTGNRIKFGDSNSENNPKYNLSSNGNSITFSVPSTYYVPCLEATPSCKIATKMIQPGSYKITVINENGTSNAVNFEVVPGV